jgi:dihydrofolate synthase/folylpolyglutamate synthase
MHFDDAISWWYGHVNYEHRAAQADELKLDRMKQLLQRLGSPHERLRIVHVAGSKGKGSTAAMLACVLAEAGYRTGLFTSPHLVHVRERFLVNQEPIHDGELLRLLHDIRKAVDRADPPTFFEIATATAFLHFARRRADAVVLEVGLGGRLDSTNVCQPVLSILTSISFDHTQQLGNTLDRIAFEKAGIIKPGVPVISGVLADAARRVIIETCMQRHASLWQLDRDFCFHAEPGRVDARLTTPPRLCVQTPTRRWPPLALALLGRHQAANASLVVAAVERLRNLGWHVSDDALARGLAQVVWPARLDVLCRQPLVVLDCAHNVASAEALTQALTDCFPDTTRRLVFAASKDKDLQGMLNVLVPRFTQVFLTRYAAGQRAAQPDDLARLLPKSVSSSTHDRAGDALNAAIGASRPTDLVCIAGSVFLAGEILALHRRAVERRRE